MHRLLRTFLSLMLLLGSIVPAIASADVVNNVLLKWREQVEKCSDSDRSDDVSMVHVAMFEAINSIVGKYTPYKAMIKAAPGSSVDAAAATAAHDVLAKICPDMKSGFDGALKSSLALVKDSVSRENGAAVGKQAAIAILAARENAHGEGKDPFFVTAKPGVYVPTLRQTGMRLAKETPWIMTRPDELRPPPPPALSSPVWTRDYREITKLGGKKSDSRTDEQRDTGKFWAGRDVRIVLRQLVALPGRNLVDDARFLALAEMAWEDSYVAMMDGKYAYNFWRPVTAIRGGIMDGNDSTAADSAWEAMVTTPSHPEYPCGHCLSAAAVGTVIAKEFGDRMPTIVLDQDSTMLRRYSSAQDYIDEVSEARILAGVHYRFSTDVGKAMGVSIGKLAVERYFKRQPKQRVAR
ncbi:MAG: vanadium-dependent haloperoxidase [Longimicrobiales bacterium]